MRFFNKIGVSSNTKVCHLTEGGRLILTMIFHFRSLFNHLINDANGREVANAVACVRGKKIAVFCKK